jgi:Glycosyl transferase family group 2
MLVVGAGRLVRWRRAIVCVLTSNATKSLLALLFVTHCYLRLPGGLVQVTEDLALSYAAFTKGYEMVYVRHIAQLLELPSNIMAHIQQKHRWSKGFLQVFRLAFPEILRSPKADLWVKIEMLAHATGPVQYTTVWMLAVMYPLISYLDLQNDFIVTVSLIPTVAEVIEAVMAVLFKISSSEQEYKSWFSKTLRFIFVLPHFALKTGMCLFETRATIEGLTSNDATFLTTPKVGSSSGSKQQALG